MKTKSIAESNRAAWNQATEYHQKARNNSLHIGFARPEFTTFDRDCDTVLLAKLKSVDFSGKTISQMPCNNGRELLSLLRFGAKEAIGFDISDAAVAEAYQLTAISKLNAKFERVNILEIGAKYDQYFDFIYISEGSLQWFPDLNEYFAVVSRLLKRGGGLLVFEIHPFAYFFENGLDPARPNFNDLTSYFSKGPYSYKNGLDYVGGVQYKARICYWFMHKMSDILGALLRNSIAIDEFNEYNLEMANNHALKFFDQLPLSYMLSGNKK